jgi:hypothetical protein
MSAVLRQFFPEVRANLNDSLESASKREKKGVAFLAYITHTPAYNLIVALLCNVVLCYFIRPPYILVFGEWPENLGLIEC